MPVSLITATKFHSTLASGEDNAAGRVFTYAAGTTTPQATYTDASLTTPNSNPIILDGTGRASVWLDTSLSYKFVIQDSAGAATPDGTVDNIRGDSGSQVADLAALRLQPKAANKVVFTRVYNAAAPEWGGGGDYVCDLADTTSPNNDGTVIVGADGGRWKLQVYGESLPARQCGVTGSGAVGESAKLIAADGMARALRKSLFIEGTPLLDTQIVLANPTSWVFAGWNNIGGDGGGVTAATVPASWLKVVTQAVGQSAVVVTHPGIRFYGGGIGCNPSGSWLFDGITINANSFRWEGGPTVFGMGRDGIRIGSNAGEGEYNANSVVLDNPRCTRNGRHGINISDEQGIEDANVFLITSPVCTYNSGHGIRFGNTYLGGTVITPTIERNTIGLYFESASRHINVFGGDVEDNTTPSGLGTNQNLVMAGLSKWTNSLEGLVIQGRAMSTPRALSNTTDIAVFGGTAYTPVPYGATAAGTPTYVGTPKGSWILSNGILNVYIDVRWSAHTGTGQLYCTLPNLFPGTSIVTQIPTIGEFIPVTVATDNVGTPSLAAGKQIVGLIRTDTSPPRIQLYVSDLGVITGSPWGVPGQGRLIINAQIPLFEL